VARPKELVPADSADREVGLDTAATLLETLELEGLSPNRLAMRRALEELGDWIGLAFVPGMLLSVTWALGQSSLPWTLPIAALVVALWTAVLLGVAADEIRGEAPAGRAALGVWVARLSRALALALVFGAASAAGSLALSLGLHAAGAPEDWILSALALGNGVLLPLAWFPCLAEAILLGKGPVAALRVGLLGAGRGLLPGGAGPHRSWAGLLGSLALAIPVALPAALVAGLLLLALGSGVLGQGAVLGALLFPADWLVTSWGYRYLAEAGRREALPEAGA